MIEIYRAKLSGGHFGDRFILVAAHAEKDAVSRISMGKMLNSGETISECIVDAVARPISAEPHRICISCGLVDYSINYSKCEEKIMMDAESMCFTCAFWEIYARSHENKTDNSDKVFFIDHVRYCDSGRVDKNTRGFVGFGGREFKIKLLGSGKVIFTNNLWCQGDIPELFWSRMPDNAEFLAGQ